MRATSSVFTSFRESELLKLSMFVVNDMCWLLGHCFPYLDHIVCVAAVIMDAAVFAISIIHRIIKPECSTFD